MVVYEFYHKNVYEERGRYLRFTAQIRYDTLAKVVEFTDGDYTHPGVVWAGVGANSVAFCKTSRRTEVQELLGFWKGMQHEIV